MVNRKKASPKQYAALNLTEDEKRRLHAERLERMPRTIKMYLQGLSLREVAEKMGVPSSAIYRDIRVAKRMWRKKASKLAEEMLDQQLEKINLMEAEAWAGWNRSLKNARTKMVQNDKEGTTTRKTQSNQAGDPRFLEMARKCVDDRCKLLKIGPYSNEESLAQHTRAVEVVVTSPDQVNRIMSYEQYTDLLEASDN